MNAGGAPSRVLPGGGGGQPKPWLRLRKTTRRPCVCGFLWGGMRTISAPRTREPAFGRGLFVGAVSAQPDGSRVGRHRLRLDAFLRLSASGAAEESDRRLDGRRPSHAARACSLAMKADSPARGDAHGPSASKSTQPKSAVAGLSVVLTAYSPMYTPVKPEEVSVDS